MSFTSLILLMVKRGYTTSLIFENEPVLVIIDPKVGEVARYRSTSGIFVTCDMNLATAI